MNNTVDSSQNPLFHSPFAHVLGTNYAPSTEHEVQSIESLLLEPQRKLDVLNHQIAQLEETLSKLKTERNSLQNYVTQHRALLTPFRRLPDELISEIFVQCLDLYPVRSTKHAPLLLTTICKSWRRVALRTPHLWCSIHLSIPEVPKFPGGPVRIEPDAGDAERHWKLVKDRMLGAERWLERSGSVPLSISLSFAPLPQEVVERLDFMFEIFIRYCSRWKELCIWGANRHMFGRLGQLQPDDVPKLQSLKVYAKRHQLMTPKEFDNLRPLMRAPALHKLQITSGHVLPLSELPVRWNQITDIHVGIAIAASDLLTVLPQMCHTVKKCTIWAKVPTAPSPDNGEELDRPPPIHLPRLESLQVTFLKPEPGFWGTIGARRSVEYDDIHKFMRNLVCPSLESLKVDMALLSKDEPMMECPLNDFLSQSGCVLKSFETNVVLSPWALGQCLRCMPSITSLSLQSHTTNNRRPQEDFDGLIRVLGPSTNDSLESSSNLLCPLMQTLYLSYFPSESASTVISLIASRIALQDSENARRLREVAVGFMGYTGEEYRSQVEGLRKRGLSIQWTFADVSRLWREVPDENHPSRWVVDRFPGMMHSGPLFQASY